MSGKGIVENINNRNKINKNEKINIVVNKNFFNSQDNENEKVVKKINKDGVNYRENKFKLHIKENGKSTKSSS